MTNVLTNISSWETILDFKKLFSIDWNRCCVQPCVSSSSCACGKKAKRPRIEALKLQMCVMVIRPLFAPILMTDLIPVFKRPTESRRYMETDILDNICVDYFYTFFLNYYNCRFLSYSDPHEVGLEEILRCKFCQSGFSPNSWAFNVQILGN